jgi:hypothetical protein
MTSTARTAVFAATLVGLGGVASAETDVERGRTIAKQHCSRCHVVDEATPFTGIASTPSFKLLVTALDDWRDRFSTFHTRLPHPSVIRFEGVAPPGDTLPTSKTVDIRLDDIDAIVAFATWLKEQQAKD